MKKSLMAVAAAVTLVLAAGTPAHAQRGVAAGVAAGIIGGAIVGAHWPPRIITDPDRATRMARVTAPATIRPATTRRVLATSPTIIMAMAVSGRGSASGTATPGASGASEFAAEAR